MKIALTGGIASGKSTASKFFNELGFYIIDLDTLSRKIYDKDGLVYTRMKSLFGDAILDKEANIDRRKLRDIIFSDIGARMKLEAITHPAIKELEKKERAKIKAKDSKALIITEGALIIETDFYKNYDIVILVITNEDRQIQNAMKRDNISETDVKKIIDSQASNTHKIKYSNIIIHNGGGLDSLEQETRRAALLIKQLDYAIRHK